jgi:hypothetical protein
MNGRTARETGRPRWAHLRGIRLRNPKERPDFIAALG